MFKVGDIVEVWKDGHYLFTGEVCEVNYKQETYSVLTTDSGYTYKYIQGKHMRKVGRYGK